MKGMSLRSAVSVLLFVVVFGSSGHAEDKGAAGLSQRDLQAKILYCKTCHGLSGQGYVGYLPMPRLAGQQPMYLENQLRAFIERRRTNPTMFNVAHVLSPSMLTALSTHFSDLNPDPIGGAPRELLAQGKTIYEEGLPDANVPACTACHNADGKGRDEIPRLAGQLFPYTVKELTNWGKERGQDQNKVDPSALMAPTAHNLTPTQVAAVAAYVSTLK